LDGECVCAAAPDAQAKAVTIARTHAIQTRRIALISKHRRCREALVFEGLRYHPDTVWTFWMTRPRIVIEIRRVAQKKRGHVDKLVERAAGQPASWVLPGRGPLPRFPDFAG
jgi:hypothetical protein